MTTGVMILAVLLTATPAMQHGTAADESRIDLRAAAAEAAEAIVAQDAEAAELEEPERGYFTMLYQDTYSPAELVYVGASIADMLSKRELQKQCAANPYVICDPGWPESVTNDALLTAGVYAGVKGVQRLAKKYWGVELDEGWKNLLIFGGMAAARAATTYLQVRDANDVRGFKP